jgi:hypothetical protein
MKMQHDQLDTFSHLPKLRTLELQVIDNTLRGGEPTNLLAWKAELTTLDLNPIQGQQYVKELIIWYERKRHVLLKVEGQSVRYCECQDEENSISKPRDCYGSAT